MSPSIPQLRKLLSSWDIGKIASIREAAGGLVNQNWIVNTDKGKYIFKRLTFNSKKSLLFELKYLKYFNRRIPYELPVPIVTKTGHDIVTHNGKCFWLYRYLEGSTKKKFGPNQVREIAKMLAAYHRAYLRIKKMVLREQIDALRRVRAKKSPNRADRIFIKEAPRLLDRLSVYLESDITKGLKHYILHHDLGPSNLLWRGSKLTGILDFEDVTHSKDPLVKDLAIVLLRGFVSDGCKINMRAAQLLVKEYSKAIRIERGALEIVPMLISVECIEDFGYAYWLFKNDRRRAHFGMLINHPKISDWCEKNKHRFIDDIPGTGSKNRVQHHG
jgi:homoserine kinase type II